MRLKKIKAFAIIIFSFSIFWAFFESKQLYGAEPDNVQDLFNFYIKKFTPQKAELVISEKPDQTGLFNDVYMDLTGIIIDKLRLDKLTVRMTGVKFNSPENWKKGNVECEDALQVYALGTILERDINKSLEEKTFGGDEDHWKKVSMAITPKGLKGKGYYIAKALFMNFDILIEIDSGLKIVGNKQLWLDKPNVKVNRLDLPDYVTKKALSQIQPLFDLKKFPLPVSLHKVELRQGSARLSTKVLPKPLKNGIKYSYSR